MDQGDEVPRLARPFVLCLLTVMVFCAVCALEAWPFTSFRLFSEARIDNQLAWRATLVNPRGEEVDYPLGGLDHGFRGFPFTMAEFAGADRARQDELCRTWVEAAPELVGESATEVRIYLRSWTLSDRADDRALPGKTELRYLCTEGGVTDGE